MRTILARHAVVNSSRRGGLCSKLRKKPRLKKEDSAWFEGGWKYFQISCLAGPQSTPNGTYFRLCNPPARSLSEKSEQRSISNLLTASSASVPSQMLGGHWQTVHFADISNQVNKPLSTLDKTCAVLNLGASFGSLLIIGLSVNKRFNDDSKVVRCAAAASYLLYVAPNYPVSWTTPSHWATMNDTVTISAIAKSFADNYFSEESMWGTISPFLESVVNLVWIIPPIGIFTQTSQHKASDIASLASNVVFDALVEVSSSL